MIKLIIRYQGNTDDWQTKKDLSGVIVTLSCQTEQNEEGKIERKTKKIHEKSS